MGIGAATLALVALAVIGWLTFLVRNTRAPSSRRRTAEPHAVPHR